jgi:hypothetical protein
MSNHRRVINREQQDAQELFQLLSSAVNEEERSVVQYDHNHGLSQAILDSQRAKPLNNVTTNNRLSCLKCGFTVSYFAFMFWPRECLNFINRDP